MTDEEHWGYIFYAPFFSRESVVMSINIKKTEGDCKMKTCLNCGKEFQEKFNKDNFCSDECAETYNEAIKNSKLNTSLTENDKFLLG